MPKIRIIYWLIFKDNSGKIIISIIIVIIFIVLIIKRLEIRVNSLV